MNALRFPPILFVGIMLFLTACSAPPRQNDQQAFESDLTEANVLLQTLHAMDSGDVAKARQVALIPICVDMAFLPSHAAKSTLTAEQKQELVSTARDTLEYLLAHRQAFDGRLPSVQMCVRGLREILTAPEDVRRLTDLSEYFERQNHDG